MHYIFTTQTCQPENWRPSNLICRAFLPFEARNVRMNPSCALGLESGDYFISILPENGERIIL
jgi:hypothetical protein